MLQVYIGEVNYELPETVKTLEKMVAELTKNEYIRYLKQPNKPKNKLIHNLGQTQWTSGTLPSF